MTAPLKFALVPVEPTLEMKRQTRAGDLSYQHMLKVSPGNDLLERINTFLRQEVPRDFISRDAEDELDKILNELGGGHG